jgi:uncharacterized membrane protein YfcA
VDASSLTPLQLTLLLGATFCAGLVDAIAGGGGLLTLPSLLAVGLPPHLALGTNKGGSMFGSGAALLRFARSGLVKKRRAWVAFPIAFVASLLGAQLVLFLKPETLRPVVLVLLVLAAAVVAFRPLRLGGEAEIAHPAELPRTALIALGIGAYDGFFGPGTGTFLIILFVALLGDSLRAGSANAKVVNFASNIGAAVLFAYRGTILWSIALPMAAAQFAGGFVGAHLAIKGGDRLVRWVVLGVVIALCLKLGRDFFMGPG